jgi:hypothetical protein
MTKPPKRAKAKTARPRKSPAARSRSFEEVVAVNLKDPFHAARIAGLESGERFDDPTAASDDRWAREVFVHPDCEGCSHWMVRTAIVPAVPNVTNGHAPTLDEAKAKFRAAWMKAKAGCCD